MAGWPLSLTDGMGRLSPPVTLAYQGPPRQLMRTMRIAPRRPARILTRLPILAGSRLRLLAHRRMAPGPLSAWNDGRLPLRLKAGRPTKRRACGRRTPAHDGILRQVPAPRKQTAQDDVEHRTQRLGVAPFACGGQASVQRAHGPVAGRARMPRAATERGCLRGRGIQSDAMAGQHGLS